MQKRSRKVRIIKPLLFLAVSLQQAECCRNPIVSFGHLAGSVQVDVASQRVLSAGMPVVACDSLRVVDNVHPNSDLLIPTGYHHVKYSRNEHGCIMRVINMLNQLRHKMQMKLSVKILYNLTTPGHQGNLVSQ